MNDGLKSKNFGYISTDDRLKGNDSYLLLSVDEKFIVQYL